MKLRAPSPALVISVIAVVVALSATAYAATRITSSSQIRNGIVTGADIKNSTIRSADIKNSTIGTQDLSKSTLKRIDGGTTGATAAFEANRKSGPVNQPANQLVKVAELKVPAGAYVIQAKTTMAGEAGQPAQLVATGNCKLDSAGSVDEANTVVLISGNQAPGSMVMQTVRTLGQESVLTVTCASAIGWAASDTSIIAQRVGSAVQTASSP